MTLRQVRIGDIFGIPLMIDYTWPPVVIFHLWMLAAFWLPARISPSLPLWQNVLVAAVITALFFGSVIFHELAHSLIARLEGIRIVGIRLHIFGGWARLAGGPRTAMVEFRVAIAGPASSFLLGVIFVIALLLVRQTGSRAPAALAALESFYYLAAANMFLAIFNLLPGLPLDGGRAVRALLWHRRRDILSATKTARRMGFVIAASLITYGLFLIVSAALRGSFWRDFLFASWMMVIGLYLAQAAESDLRAIEHSREESPSWLVDGTTGALMRRPVISVPPDLLIDDFIDQILSAHRLTSFPVARDGRLHGILRLTTLRAIAPERWPALTIGEVMEPVSEESFVSVHTDLRHTLARITRTPHRFLAVIDPDGLLVGYLDATDIPRLRATVL